MYTSAIYNCSTSLNLSVPCLHAVFGGGAGRAWAGDAGPESRAQQVQGPVAWCQVDCSSGCWPWPGLGNFRPLKPLPLCTVWPFITPTQGGCISNVRTVITCWGHDAWQRLFTAMYASCLAVVCCDYESKGNSTHTFSTILPAERLWAWRYWSLL